MSPPTLLQLKLTLWSLVIVKNTHDPTHFTLIFDLQDQHKDQTKPKINLVCIVSSFLKVIASYKLYFLYRLVFQY